MSEIIRLARCSHAVQGPWRRRRLLKTSEQFAKFDDTLGKQVRHLRELSRKPNPEASEGCSFQGWPVNPWELRPVAQACIFFELEDSAFGSVARSILDFIEEYGMYRRPRKGR